MYNVLFNFTVSSSTVGCKVSPGEKKLTSYFGQFENIRFIGAEVLSTNNNLTDFVLRLFNGKLISFLNLGVFFVVFGGF